MGIDRGNKEAAIGLRDILIIAPYNAQVFELQQRIPGGRIGTVDKFQGQEAPIVIYSLTTSIPGCAARYRFSVQLKSAKCGDLSRKGGSSLNYSSFEWLLTLQDKLGRLRRQQKSGLFTVALSEHIPNFHQKLSTKPFAAQFALTPDSILPTTGLLRGIAVEYIGPRDRARPLRFNLMPPTSPIPGAIADDKPVAVVLGRTLPLDAGLDIRPQQADAVWNRSPYGNWTIECQEQLEQLGVADVILHIWLIYS